MVRIAVNGARGKMGQRIIRLAKEDKDLEVVLGLEKTGHADIGRVIEGTKITDEFENLSECDCLIDFSSPFAIAEYIPYIVKLEKRAVIGTTGLDQIQQDKIKQASADTSIVLSPNMSVGVNLLFKLLKEASIILKGPACRAVEYTANIEEAHHVHKKDAPSGTAKKIAEILNEYQFSIKTEDIKAMREGEIIGDHNVTFDSDSDKIELNHKAKNRDIFAKGALLAAKWIMGKGNGLYSMDDVLFTC